MKASLVEGFKIRDTICRPAHWHVSAVYLYLERLDPMYRLLLAHNLQHTNTSTYRTRFSALVTPTKYIGAQQVLLRSLIGFRLQAGRLTHLAQVEQQLRCHDGLQHSG